MNVTLLCDINRRGHQHHTGDAVELPEHEAHALLQAGAAIAGPGQIETASTTAPRNAAKPKPKPRQRA